MLLSPYAVVNEFPILKALDEVDAIMKKLLDIDQEMRSHEETLNNVHQALMRGEVVVRCHACAPASIP